MKYPVHMLVAAGLCALLCTSCQVGSYEFFVPKDDSPVVARVGNVKLTMNRLDASIPPELAGSLSDDQKATFVKQWIDAEILCQAAIAEKIDKDPLVRERMAAMRRSVLGSEMVSRMSARVSDQEEVSDSALNRCYEMNKGRFTRQGDAVRYADIILPDRVAAFAVRNAVTTENFFELGRLHSTVPLPADPATIPFATSASLPKEISEVVFGIKIGGTTSPIQSADGFHIIRVIDKQKAGDVLPLKEVRGEIVAMLASDTRKSRMDLMMADLRQKVNYEFNISLLSGAAGKGQ